MTFATFGLHSISYIVLGLYAAKPRDETDIVTVILTLVFLGWAAASMAGWWWPLDVLVAVWLASLFCYIVGLTVVARSEATGGSTSWIGLGLVLVPLAGAAVS